jgi:micrococcal nuclease
MTFAIGSIFTVPAHAHPGGKDKDGCHVNSRTGERHCHAKKREFDPNTPAHQDDEGVLHGSAARITDGDTLVVKIQGAEMKFRLSDIDAPELDQPFGQEARKALESIVGNRQCVMQVVDSDSYGRTVVNLWIGDLNVNAEMIRRGMAWFYAEFARNEALYLLENEARDMKRGLWGLPKSKRLEPWEWRIRRRASRLDMSFKNQENRT